MPNNKKPFPNFPSKNPDVKPAEPQKTYNKWFMQQFTLNKNRDDDMGMMVSWRMGRTVVNAGNTEMDFSDKIQNFVFNDVLSDAFATENPEMAGMLNELLSAMEAICKRQGGLNA